MIKLLAATAMAFILLNSNEASAQQVAESGDRTFEVGVTPFSSSPVSFNQLRLRMFQADDTAYRVRGFVNYQSERAHENRRDSRTDINLAPGIEWHFFNYENISLYYGAELPLSYRTSRSFREDETWKNTNPIGFFGVGVSALAGMDLHFLQRLYTGLEVNYGLNFRSYFDQEAGDQTQEIDANELTLGPNAYPNFRLGIRF